jgi:hypothetical protein
MAQTLPGPRPEFLQHEVLSKSTQPLLNYIFRLSPHLAEEKKPKSLGKLFREVASKSDRVIPDESEQLEQVLINLIDNGPGTPVQGKSVSDVSMLVILPNSKLSSRSPLSVLVFPASALVTNSRKQASISRSLKPLLEWEVVLRPSETLLSHLVYTAKEEPCAYQLIISSFENTLKTLA